MIRSILIIFLLALYSESIIPYNGLSSEPAFQDGTLNGTWIREFNEASPGTMHNERSGRNIKQNLSGRISISFSDNQFSVSSTILSGDSSYSENIEGEYIINADTIKFYSNQKEIAVFKTSFDEDVLLLREFQNNNTFILNMLRANQKPVTMEGEYKRVRNKKGCGCGH